MGMIYTFPFKQNIGAPAEPEVVTGDLVKRGQLIAKKPDNKPGADIFSSVTGMVIDIANEKMMIEDTGTDFTEYVRLEAGSPLEMIKSSGLVGLGGAGFPTYIKLQTKLGSNGIVIINAAECEPILDHNITRIEQEPARLIDAMLLAMSILSVSRGTIAI